MSAAQLRMKQEAFRATEREGLAWKGLETGGLWLGKSVAEGLLVEDHIGPGPSARHYPRSSSPITEFQNRELDHLRQVHPERQLIATWHSHPDYLTTPSVTTPSPPAVSSGTGIWRGRRSWSASPWCGRQLLAAGVPYDHGERELPRNRD